MFEIMIVNLKILLLLTMTFLFIPPIFTLLGFSLIPIKQGVSKLEHKHKRILFLCISIALISLILFCVGLLIIGMHLIFGLLYFIFLWIGFNETVITYLALTFTLIGFSCIPKKIRMLILKVFPTDVYNDKDFVKRIFTGFIDFLNIKTLIYLFSFVLVFISGIESLTGSEVFNLSLWISIKQIVLQSVVSFIAFDRFYKAIVEDYSKNKPKINSLSSLIVDYFKKR